jgi:hypothetical protein
MGKVEDRKILQGVVTPPILPPKTAGWSSPVARQAHNLKVAGSNPAPATNFGPRAAMLSALFLILN